MSLAMAFWNRRVTLLDARVVSFFMAEWLA